MKNQIRRHSDEFLGFDERFERRAGDAIERRRLESSLLETAVDFVEQRAFLVADARAMFR